MVGYQKASNSRKSVAPVNWEGPGEGLLKPLRAVVRAVAH